MALCLSDQAKVPDDPQNLSSDDELTDIEILMESSAGDAGRGTDQFNFPVSFLLQFIYCINHILLINFCFCF